jgi:photosystem II stability/assembly factor-like uncharacterized protein
MSGVIDVAFVDPSRGWALGLSCDEDGNCAPVVDRTSDGGRTWGAGVVPLAPPGASAAAPENAATRIRFADPLDGWAFNPALYSTHDGGATWRQETVDGEVIGLEPYGSSVWMLTRSCAQPEACTFSLQVSDDSGRSWAPAPVQPRVQGSVARLVRVGGKDAWIASSAEWSGGGVVAGWLLATHDAGATWQPLVDPAAMEYCDPKLMAAADPQNLWMLCGGVPATIMQGKALFTSTDGGKTWSRRADAMPPGEGGLNNLPLVGHVSDLATISSRVAFIALGRYTLYATSDGGRIWVPSIPIDQTTARDAGVEVVRFVDDKHGWAVSGPNVIYWTDNGGVTWQAVTLP